ncbi:MAG: transporter substrate-binding domain-containing protein [Symploca sp. SIO2G7]|nr:transporter substrate-binding domain-containing protein [Symploca sp. SIO2G7]
MSKYFNKSLKIATIAVSLIAATISITACSETKTENTAQGTLAEIKEKDQIVIGVKTDYAPFGFIDSDGKNAGLEIDIARKLTEEILDSEEKVEFVPVVAANRIEFLKQGKVDLVIATMTDTEERRQEIDFSENYYSAGTGLLTKKDNNIKTWEDLKGKKVCGIQGSFYNKDLTEKGIEMVNFPGTAEAYKALKDGRCIGFAYDDSALVGKLQESEWTQDWHLPLESILQQPWGMGIRKGEEEFLTAVNDAILKMEAEGFIAEGEKKWKIPPTEYAKERRSKAKGLVDNQ